MIPLDGDALRRRAHGNIRIGRSIEILRETSSTNDVCQAKASDPANDGLVVFAESQQSGRGQRGSTWSAPPGSSLLFSLLLFPPEPLSGPHFLTAWSALAVAETLQTSLGLRAVIKWPNDLLVGGKKICGILVEKGQGTVVGIGLNVSIGPEEFPKDLRLPATSLSTLLGREIDRTELAAKLLFQLDQRYDEALRAGPSVIWESWQEHGEPLLHRQVVAFTRREEIQGQLLDLRPDKGARILRSDGTVANIPPEELVRLIQAEQ